MQTALFLAFALQKAPAPEPRVPSTGMVEIPAGRTWVGTKLDIAKKRIAETPDNAQLLGAETPRFRMDVEGFLAGPCEVTNEMYRVFIEDTGSVPPVTWARIPDTVKQDIIAEAKKESPGFVLTPTALGNWWTENWQNEDLALEWGMPGEIALTPVTFVSHEDALEYCRWSGLRLPTEFEWVRAARGDSESDFPFGMEFDSSLVAHNATSPRYLSYKILPANSFPGNASAYGCVDMAGNVWEWTDSGFDALPKFKGFRVKTTAGTTEDIFPLFDGSARVIKGGSYVNPGFVSRIDTRAGLFRDSRAPMIGFRIASSLLPCRDACEIAAYDLEGRVLDGMASRVLDFANTLGLEKRRYIDLEAVAPNRAAPPKPIPHSEPVAGYAIFGSYDCFALVAKKEIEFSSPDKVARHIRDGDPVPVGMLHTTVALKKPGLGPGTYVLSWLTPLEVEDILARGGTVPADFLPDAPDAEDLNSEDSSPEPKKGEEEKKRYVDFHEVEIVPDTQNLLVLDMRNRVVAVMPLKKTPRLERIKQIPHTITINLDKDRLDIGFRVGGPRGKAFGFRFEAEPINAEGSLVRENWWTGDWYKVIPASEE